MKECGIVKDLLPLVAEELASEETTAFVKEHLEICENCKKSYEEMKAPVETEPAAPLMTVKRAVKKRGLLTAGLIACLVAALIFTAFARLTKPIVIHSGGQAFSEVTVVPETIPLSAIGEQPEPSDKTEQDAELAMVKEAHAAIVVIDGKDDKRLTVKYMEPSDDETLPETDYTSISGIFVITSAEKPDDPADGQTENGNVVAYVYNVSDQAESGETIEPDVVVSTPKTLRITTVPGTTLLIDREGGEIGIAAYTTLWNRWFAKEAKPQETEIKLTDVDAVFFEPYSNAERQTLYVREGYTPEAGFALPRLVMNYYFLIALAGTVVLAAIWLVLRLTKKEKAARVFEILLLIAAGGTLAFLAAGFPATTIAPLRELVFVLVIAVLLIGAGLCGRKLLKKA